MAEMTSNPGARFEIAIDGTPRAWCGDRTQAIETGLSLKESQPGVGVTVRDDLTGDMWVIIKRKGTGCCDERRPIAARGKPAP
jgi:hypothetical protein